MTKTILVVDDEPVVLQVAAQILKVARFDVVTAANGKEALEICLGDTPPVDLLLTDIMMPRMNGVELARCLANERPAMPVLFMTGHSAGTRLKDIFVSQPGMANHALLEKPFTSRQLAEAVTNLLRQSDGPKVRRAGSSFSP